MHRKDSFFGLHFDLHPRADDTVLGADVTEENIERLLVRVRPDFVHYDCKGHEGLAGYPTKVGTPSPGIVKDSLAIWREVTRRHGVLFGIHFSGVVDHQAVKDHPDWAAWTAEGKPSTEATSTFGPYVDELLIPQLKEVIDRYDVDSIWLDGECWGAILDYSPAALEAWRRDTGYEDAPKDSSDPRWLEWKMFHRRQFEVYLKRWVDALHAHKPGVAIASNWAYTTMCPKPVEVQVDYISGDFDPKLSVDRARTEARYLCNVGLPWELQSWGFDFVKDQNEALKLPIHLKQEASVILMHGGGYLMYFLPTRSGYINDTIIETAGEVADFCRERQTICHRSTSVPQVALLHSSETQFDRSDRVFTWWDKPLHEIEGALHALLESHYSVDILAEYMLEPRLSEFPLVVIPDSHRLTDSFRQSLMRYVENGGNLLLLGERCARLFEPWLGVQFDGEPHAVNATLVSSEGKLPAAGVWQDVTVTSAEPIAYRFHGDGPQGRHSYLDVRDQGVSPDAARNVHRRVAATVSKHGKGSIAAVYGPVPLLYYNSHHPYLRRFVHDIVERLFPDPAVRIDAPSCVDLALRRSQDGRLCVHLLNLANMPVSHRRSFADYIPPVGPISVQIRIDRMPQSVTWEPEGRPLSWSWSDGILNFEIDRLEIHGVAVIDE